MRELVNEERNRHATTCRAAASSRCMSVLTGMLEPTEPIAGTTTVRRDNKNLNVSAQLAIEDIERKSRYSIAPNARWKLHWIHLRVFTNLDHCSVKGGQVAFTEPTTLLLVVRDVLKVFNPCRLSKRVTHLSRAWAWRRTSSAATRFINPRSNSSARRAASRNQSCSISLSESESRLDRSCSANSARC